MKKSKGSAKQKQSANKRASNKNRRDRKRAEGKQAKLKTKKDLVISQHKKFNNYLSNLLASPEMQVQQSGQQEE